MNPDLAHIWPAIQSELKRAVPEHTYDIWLAPLRPVASTATRSLVEAPDGPAAAGRRALRPRAAVLRRGRARAQATVDVVAPGRVPRETPARCVRGRRRRATASTGASRSSRPARAGAPRRRRDARTPPGRPHEGGRPRPAAAPRRRGTRAEPEVHLRAVRHRRHQPLRPRRRARRRRARRARPTTRSSSTGRPGVGKTHLLHAIGNYIRRYGGGLTVRYTTVEALHQRVHLGAARRRHRALQGALPPHRRPAHRRHPVPRVQGQDRGGVLPHLQRAAGHRQPARAHLRPAAARSRRAPRPPARALRGRPGHRHPAARPRDAHDGPAQARPPRRRRGLRGRSWR